MDLRALGNYVAKVLGKDVRLEKITTNRTNPVYKTEGLIVKHYLDHVEKIPSIKFGVQRAVSEYKALKLFEKILGKGFVPEVVHFDDSAHVLIMTDENKGLSFEDEENLGELKTEDYVRIAEMIAKIHVATDGKDMLSAEKFTDYDLLRLFTAETMYPKDVEKFKEELKKIEKCIIWADCSPKNIFVSDKIVFFDFEFSHYNAPCLDVGFFLAHMFLFVLKNKEFKEKIMNSIEKFIETYKNKIKEKYDGNKIIEFALMYSGFILLHKVYSIAKYERYSSLNVKEVAEWLIKNKDLSCFKE